MGQVLGDLARFAVRPLSLLAMISLLAFSVGYSIFIGEMTRGAGPEAALRFAGLNQLFGVLSATLSAIVVFVLSRRVVRDEGQIQASRLGAFITLSAAIFLIAQFIQMIWPLVLVAVPRVPDAWLATAIRSPSLILVVILFPLGVWRVGLARGDKRPTLSETWARVWRTQRGLVFGAFLLAAAALLQLQVMQPLMRGDSGLSPVVELTVTLAPSAVASVLQVLLAIIAYRRIIPAEGQRVAEVFA